MIALYNDFGEWLGTQFPYKVQKISLNAGFTCPNRDGTKGVGGCTYCNNQTFSPDYCQSLKSVSEQLQEGMCFFARKYPNLRYLAYFQSYTNTYGDLRKLRQIYEEALSVEGVVGLVIGTRPDCMPDALLDYLSDLNKQTFVLVEYGVESMNDMVLKRINRGHTYAESVEAIQRTDAAGIKVGAHVIMGLPGEDRIELLRQATLISELPLTTLKLHQLQLVRGTRMAAEYAERSEDFHLFEMNEYVDLVIDYVERLRPSLVLDRFVSQSPDSLLIAPRWGVKNHEFTDRVRKRMKERGAYQGRLWSGKE